MQGYSDNFMKNQNVYFIGNLSTPKRSCCLFADF